MMKPRVATSALFVLLASSACAGGVPSSRDQAVREVVAPPEVVSPDDVEGREYHSDIYEEAGCGDCHGTSEVVVGALPADGVCLDCHDQEEVIQATMPESPEEKWQNPHNNMHWGTDVPCMECHGEHSSRKPVCQGCHSFEYDNFHE